MPGRLYVVDVQPVASQSLRSHGQLLLQTTMQHCRGALPSWQCFSFPQAVCQLLRLLHAGCIMRQVSSVPHTIRTHDRACKPD